MMMRANRGEGARRLAGVLLTCLLLSGLLRTGSVRAENAEPPPDVPGTYQRSYVLEAAGKYDEAFRALDGIQGAERGTYFFLLRRGWLAYLTGDYAVAQQSYEAALERKPGSLEARLGLLLPQMARRRFREAARTAAEILKQDPLNYLANLRLASVYYQSGRYDEAAECFRRLLTIYPGDLTVANGLAWSLLKQGRKAEARKLFRSILDVAPEHDQARQGMQILE